MWVSLIVDSLAPGGKKRRKTFKRWGRRKEVVGRRGRLTGLGVVSRKGEERKFAVGEMKSLGVRMVGRWGGEKGGEWMVL